MIAPSVCSTEVTPEIADALADEAERGYGLSKARRRREAVSRYVKS